MKLIPMGTFKPANDIEEFYRCMASQSLFRMEGQMWQAVRDVVLARALALEMDRRIMQTFRESVQIEL